MTRGKGHDMNKDMLLYMFALLPVVKMFITFNEGKGEEVGIK